MKRILVATGLVTGLLVAALPPAMTAPKPFEAPVSWELKFEYEAPQPIKVLLPKQKKPKTYWYMLYSVTNLTRDPATGRGADQGFIPEFTMYTDTGKSIIANRQPRSAIVSAIRKRHNLPLLKSHIQIMGKLLYGRDNAKKGVAIWPDFDPAAGSFDIFVGGLSGETAEITLPRPITVIETDANGVAKAVIKNKVILHKAMQLNYTVKGETEVRIYSKAKFNFKKWVLR